MSQRKHITVRLIASLTVSVLMILLTILAIRGKTAYPGQAPQERFILDDLVDLIAKHKEVLCITASILAGLFAYVKIGRGLFFRI